MKHASIVLAALLCAASKTASAQFGGDFAGPGFGGLAGSQAQATNNVQIEIDELGLKSLKWKGREFISRDNDSQGLQLRGATLEMPGGEASQVSGAEMRRAVVLTPPEDYSSSGIGPGSRISFRRPIIGTMLEAGKPFVRPWVNGTTISGFEGNWGRVTTEFFVDTDSVFLTTTVENTGDQIIRGADIQLATLRFPSTPANFKGDPRLDANRDAPALLEASSADPKDDWDVLIENQTAARPLIWGFPYSTDKPANRTYPLIVSTRGVNWLGNLLDPYIDKPLLPGASERIKIVLHFGTRAEIAKVRAQVLADYAKRFPPLLKWDDRRPIGMAVLSTSSEAHHSKSNPRGWFNDPNFNAFDAASFKKRALDYAREVVRHCREINAQGVIVWDLEGQEFPHATSYLGDPRALPPESEAVADEFFKTLRDGGLKVGLCIRPQRPVRAAYGGGVQQIETENPAQTLIDKIGHARKRWNGTMFYVDSNGDPNVPFPAQIFEQVLAAHPDVLLIPEHQSARYYRSGAPYDELRGGVSSTPAWARELYPRAFSVIALSDGDVKARRAELVRAVRAGDVLMSRVWFDDSFSADVKSIYDEASKAKGTPQG